jgi:hypothetical protein
MRVRKPHESPKSKKPKCGSKTRSGRKCKNPPSPGRERCHLHGGATPRGVDSPNWKHGRYSKDLPARLLADYEASRNAPDILRLHDEIATCDARLMDLFRKLESGETANTWQTLKDLSAAFVAQREAAELEAMQKTIGAIIAEIEKGGGEFAAWREINGQLEMRRRLVESEARVQLNLSANLTYETVGLFYAALTAAVKEEAPPDVVQRIQAKFYAITERHDSLRLAS